MKVLRTSVLVCLMTFLSSCVVQSSQFNALINLFKDSSLDVSIDKWHLRFSNYESYVYAISTRNGILFSNSKGDYILFDGWIITSIQDLGGRQLNISINDYNNLRSFKRGNRIVSNHDCQKWKYQSSNELTRFYQDCSGKQDYKNTISVKKDGNISMIRQIVDERYTALTLIKLE